MPKVARYIFHEVPVEACGAVLTIAEDESGSFYFPVRATCQALGIASSSSQIEDIKTDSRLKAGLAEVPLPTRGGAQRTKCLRRREYTWWLAIIDPAKVNAAARPRLAARQQALMDLADQIMFLKQGERPPAHHATVVYTTPERVTVSGEMRFSGEYHFDCKVCGAAHCIIIDETGAHLYVEERIE